MVDFNAAKNNGTFQKLGGGRGADMFAGFSEVNPDLAEYVEDFAFGQAPTRLGIALRDREFAGVAALMALNTSQTQLEATSMPR